MRALAFLAILLSGSLAALAQDGLVLESDQGVYRKDGLFLKVYLVDDPKVFLKELLHPANPQNVQIKTRTVFNRGDVVFPAILYHTNALTSDGKADISYDYVFRRPDGSIYEKMENRTVVLGRPPKGVGLVRDLTGLKIEETDPLGDYKVEVAIHDRNRKVTVEMPFTFTVAEKSAKPPSLLTPEAAPETSDYTDRGESASTLLSPKEVKVEKTPNSKP